MIVLPDGVLAMSARGPDWDSWVSRLPRLAAEVIDEWDLVVEGPPLYGYCSMVIPVTSDDRPAMLKLVGWPDVESEHEHLALQRWHGAGVVHLITADPRRRALLLERLHPTDLTDLWDQDACEIVAGLYGRIHVPALPDLRTLTSYVDRWVARLAALPRDAPLPRRLVEQAVSLGRDLVADPASIGTMIHGDLHYENVLAADREPWLVIDPKPMSGDPHYEPAPMLWNRFDELAGDVRNGVRRRFHTIVDAADLDEDRARAWVIVRMLLNASWQIADGDPGDLTRCVSIAKAVQD